VFPHDFLSVLCSIETQQSGLTINYCLKIDGTTPDHLQILQHIPGIIDFQIDPIMLMPQQQFAPIAEISIFHVNPWFAKIRQAKK